MIIFEAAQMISDRERAIEKERRFQDYKSLHQGNKPVKNASDISASKEQESSNPKVDSDAVSDAVSHIKKHALEYGGGTAAALAAGAGALALRKRLKNAKK